jgi:hypothetical protein
MMGEDYETSVKVYGSPWQPEFYNWAFNLPRMGWELGQKWTDIPENTDILITHGPAWGHLDTIKGHSVPLGCELLAERIKILKPKIHVFGHIHTGYGYKFDGDTHFFNAAVLDERYNFTQKPFTVDWDSETNEMEFLRSEIARLNRLTNDLKTQAKEAKEQVKVVRTEMAAEAKKEFFFLTFDNILIITYNLTIQYFHWGLGFLILYRVVFTSGLL